MGLTLQQRLNIYQKCLEMYEGTEKTEFIHDYTSRGLCMLIQGAAILLQIDNPSPYVQQDEYPEIYKHKPYDIDDSDHWFPIGQREPRIKILKAAIAEVTAELSKQ